MSIKTNGDVVTKLQTEVSRLGVNYRREPYPIESDDPDIPEFLRHNQKEQK